MLLVLSEVGHIDFNFFPDANLGISNELASNSLSELLRLVCVKMF